MEAPVLNPCMPRTPLLGSWPGSPLADESELAWVAGGSLTSVKVRMLSSPLGDATAQREMNCLPPTRSALSASAFQNCTCGQNPE